MLVLPVELHHNTLRLERASQPASPGRDLWRTGAERNDDEEMPECVPLLYYLGVQHHCFRFIYHHPRCCYCESPERRPMRRRSRVLAHHILLLRLFRDTLVNDGSQIYTYLNVARRCYIYNIFQPGRKRESRRRNYIYLGFCYIHYLVC